MIYDIQHVQRRILTRSSRTQQFGRALFDDRSRHTINCRRLNAGSKQFANWQTGLGPMAPHAARVTSLINSRRFGCTPIPFRAVNPVCFLSPTKAETVAWITAKMPLKFCPFKAPVP